MLNGTDFPFKGVANEISMCTIFLLMAVPCTLITNATLVYTLACARPYIAFYAPVVQMRVEFHAVMHVDCK